MKVRKNGIYKTIESSDFGIYQQMGFEKVVDDVIKEPVKEEVVMPKSKKKKA